MLFKIYYDYLPKTIVRYLMDWRNREEVMVSKWLKDQIEVNREMLEQVIVDNDLFRTSNDSTVIKVLKWVEANITYTSDRIQYKTVEKWATCAETLASGQGDCEDGAILMYCLCRVAGISHHLICIVAGSVQSGGHCWVRYQSTKYIPGVVCYLDWCYYYSDLSIYHRAKYMEHNGKVIGSDDYLNLWFIANDDSAMVFDY